MSKATGVLQQVLVWLLLQVFERKNSTLIYNFKYGIDNSILIRDTIVDTREEMNV